ncbi:MAG: hypothetical protein AAGF92_10690 [Myxococcota bacterium]
MNEALALTALLCWLVVMMGAFRASALTPAGTARRIGFAVFGLAGFVVSWSIALRHWPTTVAIWWWLVTWIAAALLVVWAGAYLQRHARSAPVALASIGVAGAVAAWGLG